MWRGEGSKTTMKQRGGHKIYLIKVGDIKRYIVDILKYLIHKVQTGILCVGLMCSNNNCYCYL